MRADRERPETALRNGPCQARSAVRRLASASFSLHTASVGIVLSVAPLILVFSYAVLAQSANPRHLMQKASADAKRGEKALAVKDYQEILRLYPHMVAAHSELGALLTSLGRYDEAIEQLRAALAEEPGSASLRLNLAIVYLQKGDNAEAARLLTEIHRDGPGSVRVATLLGNCDLRLGRVTQAIALLTPLEKAAPGNLDLEWTLGSALIRAGQTRKGLERIQRVAEQKQNAAAYLLAGEAALKLDLLVQARRDVNEAIRLEPNLPGAYTASGIVADSMGDYAGAVAGFKKALEANPNDFQARLHLGALYYHERDLKAAEEQLNLALKLGPNPFSYLARYQLARVKLARGQTDAALEDFQAVEREHPNWLPPHIELVALYYRLKRPSDGAREKKIVNQLREEERRREMHSRAISPQLP